MELTDEKIDEIGFALEEGGLSHSQIDTYFEHHGVKGMKWGQRRKRNKALNRASRERDREAARKEADKFARKVDAARGRVASGKHDQAIREARQNRKANKQKLGSREARKIINDARGKKALDVALASQPRDNREAGERIVKQLLASVVTNAIKNSAKAA